MKNEIILRVFDFIKEWPPFNLLPKEALMTLAGQALVKYLPKDTVLFKIGDSPNSYFYMVNIGAVHLIQEDEHMVESCDEGDVFGLRPLLAKSPYLLKAVAAEDTLLFCFHTDDFMPFIEKNPKIVIYLATNFAVGVGNMYYQKSSGSSLLQNKAEVGIFSELFYIDAQKKPIFCTPEITIQEGAKIMTQYSIGSVVVCDEQQRPIGIVTDKDLRVKVVAGAIRKKENIQLIMSSPVVCISSSLTIAEIQILMIKNKINHLAVTEDGTTLSRLIGVISEHDLVVQQGNNPAILIKEIKKSTDGKALRSVRDKVEVLIQKYLAQEVSIGFVSEIVSEINDEIIKQAIVITKQKLGNDLYNSIHFCWLAIGSEGREEQLLRTDQDNALIYQEDDSIPDLKEKCLELAKGVTEILNEVGYEFCPANMMASNPEWCKSSQEWKDIFARWMYQPGEKEIMMCTIFFDYRPIYGNVGLAKELTDFIFDTLDKRDVFLHILAQNALENPPPLSFFRNFIVEKNGDHKDEFDIKLRAMMPLADAARLLVLASRIPGYNNTPKRYLALADADPNHADLYRMAADAYEILIRIRTLDGLQNQNSGRYINPKSLDKMHRLLLRNCFQPIDELQKLIKVRFQVGGII